MGFSHAQTTAYGVWTSGQTASATLGSNPALHDVVCVFVYAWSTGLALTSVKDENNNVYVVSPKSPQNTFSSTAGILWLCYLLDAPSNAGKTITATLTGTISGLQVYVDDFTVSGGVAVFDNDATAAFQSTSSPVTGLSLTPAKSHELFYAAGGFQSTAVSGVGGGWTQNDHGIGAGGENCEYALDVSSAMSVYFQTDGTTQNVELLEMGFQFALVDTITEHVSDIRLS